MKKQKLYSNKLKMPYMTNNEIVEKWLSENFGNIEATCNFWGRTAICKPLIQDNPYIKTNETLKTKINGVTFRYKVCGAMVATKTYQIVYKLLKH